MCQGCPGNRGSGTLRGLSKGQDFFCFETTPERICMHFCFYFLPHISLSAAMSECPIGLQVSLFCLAVHCHSQWGNQSEEAVANAWDVDRGSAHLEAPKCVWNPGVSFLVGFFLQESGGILHRSCSAPLTMDSCCLASPVDSFLFTEFRHTSREQSPSVSFSVSMCFNNELRLIL